MASERRNVGLLVLNWNGAEVLPACLDSLAAAAARSRHALRLLLVDNGSADGSAERGAAAHPGWQLLSLEENRGFAGGVNAGLERLLADGCEHVCVLNNDIEVEPDLIDPLVADLEADDRRGAACPRIHYHGDRDRLWYAGGAVSRLGLVSRHLGIRQRAEGRWLQAADTGYLTGCCLLGRAQFWKTTGGFDERFGMYAEDVDLSLRARALGWTLRYQPLSVLYHRVGFSSGGGLSARKLRAQRLAAGRLIRRHLPPPRRPLAYCAWGLHALRGALGALLRGERGVFTAILRALAPAGQGGKGKA